MGESFPGYADDNLQKKTLVQEQPLKSTVSSGQPATAFWSIGALGGAGRGSNEAVSTSFPDSASVTAWPLSNGRRVSSPPD